MYVPTLSGLHNILAVVVPLDGATSSYIKNIPLSLTQFANLYRVAGAIKKTLLEPKDLESPERYLPLAPSLLQPIILTFNVLEPLLNIYTEVPVSFYLILDLVKVEIV